MGILLSQHGVGPMEGKVRAVKEASHPITLSEVRSFLGLVGFSSTFIPDFATIAEPLSLALVWTCERFNLYLNGLPEFHLVTDHQALKTIFGSGSKPSARIKHWVLRLQSFNYRVCFVSSRNNIADALSRLTKIPASQGYIQDEEYVREVTLLPVALRIKEIEEASTQDEDLRVVHARLQSGD